MCGQFPETWGSIPLDHLAVYILGGDWGKNADYNDPDYVRVRCIRASELRDWNSNHGSTAALRKIKKSSLARRQLRDGDIVIEVSGGGPEQPVGRTALINSTVLAKDPRYPKICTNFFRLLRPAREMNSSYLDHYLKFFYKTGKIASYQRGSNNLRNLKFDDYLTIRVPVPPAREQDRIVAKVEELFSELDKGIESLKTARALLKVYRQAVLKHAFEGKLTAQWREENKDKLEEPEQLLVRIEKKREAQFDRRLQDWEAAVRQWESDGKVNRKPVKPKRSKSPIPVRSQDREQLVNLPKGWAWIRLAQLFDVSPQNGIYKPASEYGNGTQIIRIDDFYDGRLVRRTGFKRLRLDSDEIEKFTLRNADLMVNRVNSIEYLGKCAVVGHLTETTVFESNIMKCSFVEDEVSMAYIAAYLSSKEGRERLCENAKHAVNQASINQTDVGNTLVPITFGNYIRK